MGAMKMYEWYTNIKSAMHEYIYMIIHVGPYLG